jgi:tellurite resistance protein TerC
VVEISTGTSLLVILVVLVITIFGSLFSTRGRTQTAMANVRRDAAAYLDAEYTVDPVERERIYLRLIEARDHIIALGPKAKQIVRNEPELLDLCRRASDSHAAAHPAHSSPLDRS